MECLAGIPGSTGATPIQNVGAYGQEIAETLDSVLVLDRQPERSGRSGRTTAGSGTHERVQARARALGRAGGDVALRRARAGGADPLAELARALGVQPGDSPPPARVRDAVLALRRGKGMVLDPADRDTYSVGSFFTNPILPRGRALPGRRAVVPARGTGP